MNSEYAAAADFLENEAAMTPQQLYEEVVIAMNDVAAIENKRNHARVNSIWFTLLTCADMLKYMSNESRLR